MGSIVSFTVLLVIVVAVIGGIGKYFWVVKELQDQKKLADLDPQFGNRKNLTRAQFVWLLPVIIIVSGLLISQLFNQ